MTSAFHGSQSGILHPFRLTLSVYVGHDHVARTTIERDGLTNSSEFETPMTTKEHQVLEGRLETRPFTGINEIRSELALIERSVRELASIARLQRKEHINQWIGQVLHTFDETSGEVAELFAGRVEHHGCGHQCERMRHHGVDTSGGTHTTQDDAGGHSVGQLMCACEYERPTT